MAGIVFDEPITAGTVLVREAIQSQNYAPGTAGWWIGSAGDAEFNNLTLRGQFLGNDYVISEAGIFFYSGTPAAGNMTGSWAPADGTDPYGNVYAAGLTLYSSIGTVFLGGADGIIKSTGASGATISIEDGQINYGLIGDARTAFTLQDYMQQHGSLATVSGGDVSAVSQAAHQVVSVSGFGTPGDQDTYPRTSTSQPTNSTNAPPAYHYVSGAVVKSNGDASASETWHAAPAAAANWSMITLQYRLDAEDNVIWSGRVDFTGASITAAGAQIVSATAVDPKFRPKADRRLGITHSTSGGVLKNVAALLIVRADGFISISWGDGMTGTAHDAAGNANGDRYEFTVAAPLGNLK